MTELTEALTAGGGSKITMDRLEQSIKTLKNLFIERHETIEVRQQQFKLKIIITITFCRIWLQHQRRKSSLLVLISLILEFSECNSILFYKTFY